ncbi:hypothetical protein DPMN_032026 [Dreissena polymorpha]|uniref:Uncharacterized protein n=1 Tax=Dreissena polymorpha TaxID=45954 RepID=A0A9D4M478_DREPO|nr:hypothetical protein DPMN_032026 [Dreissena polymorpha]
MWHFCSAHRDPSNDAVLAVIGLYMAVSLTSEDANFDTIFYVKDVTGKTGDMACL